jgi:hypothetical protein
MSAESEPLPATTPTAEQQIAEVLRQHSITNAATWANERICLCGAMVRVLPPGPDFAEHVAGRITEALQLHEATERLRAAAESEASKSWRDLLSLDEGEAYGRNQAGEHLLAEIARLPWVGPWRTTP